MKKILISLSIIGIAAGVVAGGTIAFFNDTETSTGNIITAGSIDITVDSNGSSYNGTDLLGTNFPAKDLTSEKFFVFDDIKPGDYGTRHISLHVAKNSAYACLLLDDKVDLENVLTGPETAVGDTTSVVGEMSKNIDLFAWEDLNGNQVYDPTSNNEPALLTNGNFAVDSFFDITYVVIFDSNSTDTSELVPNVTRNIALTWCAGTQTVNNTTGVVTCDGSGMGDEVQTDSFTANVVLFGEQVRNNPDFECSDVQL